MKGKAVLILFFGLGCAGLFAQEQPGADVLYREGKFQAAIDLCLQELEESPKNINAYCYIMWSLFALKRYSESYDYARKGMEVSRYDRRMILGAGEALFNLGKNREALKYFEEYTVYVSSATYKDEVYNYMGEIFIRLGEFNNADIAFSTAVHYNSKNAAWWARLGYAREMAKDFTWSLDAYKKALELNSALEDAKLGRDRVTRLLNE